VAGAEGANLSSSIVIIMGCCRRSLASQRSWRGSN